ETETSGDDQWMVAIAPGNVQMMSVDQLDAAYQGGQINDHTMVWTQGMDAWLPLAQVIGGDEDEENAAQAVQHQQAQPQHQQAQPQHQQAQPQHQQAQPQHQQAQPQHQQAQAYHGMGQSMDAQQVALQQQADAASA